MSSTTNNYSLLGDATPDGIAVWVCGVALILLLGTIIRKVQGSRDLRFLTCCVLIGIFGILAFVYLSPEGSPSSSEQSSAKSTTELQQPAKGVDAPAAPAKARLPGSRAEERPASTGAGSPSKLDPNTPRTSQSSSLPNG